MDGEKELIEQYRREGNLEILAQAYQHYAVMIRGIIARIVLNETVAEDLMQDTFVQATRNLEGFAGRSSLKTWLCRIAVNNANGYLRKHISARNKREDILLQQTVCDPMTPRESVFWKDENRRVSEAIERLDPTLRTALLLTAVEDMEPAEVATIQNCTRSTVYWRVYQARKKLKEWLHENE